VILPPVQPVPVSSSQSNSTNQCSHIKFTSTKPCSSIQLQCSSECTVSTDECSVILLTSTNTVGNTSLASVDIVNVEHEQTVTTATGMPHNQMSVQADAVLPFPVLEKSEIPAANALANSVTGPPTAIERSMKSSRSFQVKWCNTYPVVRI
jgi:hypothetical protein